MSAESLLAEICAALGVEVTPIADSALIGLTGKYRAYAPLPRSGLDEIASELARHPAHDASRWTQTSFEVVLVPKSPIRARFIRDENITLESPELGLTYQLGPVSPELSLGMILQMSPATSQEMRIRLRRTGPMLMQRTNDGTPRHALSDIAVLFRKFQSLRVESVEEKSIGQFRRYVNSFIFHLAYNIDYSLTRATIDDLYPSVGRRGVRQDESELDAPRLAYDDELVSRYADASASSDAISGYLGFYHVLESQFEGLYNEFVVDKVRRELSSPNFSLRRDRDVTDLVRAVSKLVRERQNETAGIDEKRALRLTLDKYVDLPSVVSRINSPHYIEELREREVTFSHGSRVDLEGDPTIVMNALANRIYDTRNAVVHAKETAQNRFRPASDSAELERETKLMRALAEEVIISKGKLLE